MDPTMEAHVKALETSGTNLVGVAEYCVTAHRTDPASALAQSKQYAVDALVRG